MRTARSDRSENTDRRDDRDLRVDVAVVGAGAVGLATAWELVNRGRSVAVIDPDPGSGASRAAAGMLAPVSEVQYQQDELSALMLDAAAEYPRFIAALEEAAGQSAGYRTTDTLVCAAHPADRTQLADLQQLQQAHGMAVDQLTTRTARSLEPALHPRLAGAFRITGDHQVDPRRLVGALLAALQNTAGAEGRAEVIRARADSLLREDTGAVTGVVLAGGRRIHARETVLAVGTGLDRIGGLDPRVLPPVRPVHGDILRTRLPAGMPVLVERTIRGVVNGVPVYLVPRTDGEIVVGASSREDHLDGPSAGAVFRLLRDAQAIAPGVADLELTEVMARARPATPDDVPCIGRLREGGSPAERTDHREPPSTPAQRRRAGTPGLVLSVGHYRHGVLLAPLAARLVGQLITGQSGPDPRTDATHLRTADPNRFEHPLTAGTTVTAGTTEPAGTD